MGLRGKFRHYVMSVLDSIAEACDKSSSERLQRSRGGFVNIHLSLDQSPDKV